LADALHLQRLIIVVAEKLGADRAAPPAVDHSAWTGLLLID
jgi:hypothetical protein